LRRGFQVGEKNKYYSFDETEVRHIFFSEKHLREGRRKREWKKKSTKECDVKAAKTEPLMFTVLIKKSKSKEDGG